MYKTALTFTNSLEEFKITIRDALSAYYAIKDRKNPLKGVTLFPCLLERRNENEIELTNSSFYVFVDRLHFGPTVCTIGYRDYGGTRKSIMIPSIYFDGDYTEPLLELVNMESGTEIVRKCTELKSELSGAIGVLNGMLVLKRNTARDYLESGEKRLDVKAYLTVLDVGIKELKQKKQGLKTRIRILNMKLYKLSRENHE